MHLLYLLREAQFHGAIRLADDRHRWWWALSLTFLLYGSVSIVKDMIGRYFDNPTYLVKMEVTENHTPFPSVLVCPEIVFPDHRISLFLEKIMIPSGMNASYIRKIIPQLSAFYAPDMPYSMEDLEQIQFLLDYNNLNIEVAGKRLTASCEETLLKCTWKSKLVNCSSIFQTELTKYGYCCVFNGRSLRRELKKYGLHKLKPSHKYFAGHNEQITALVVAVNQSQNTANVDLSYKWLAVEGSQHYVESNVNGTAISPGTEEWAEYSYRRLLLTDEAKGLSDDLRRCRLSQQPLTYFPIYHKSYCLLECEMARIMQLCHCARMVDPRPPGVGYCRAQKLLCVKSAAVSYLNYCNCPPTCDIDSDYVVQHSYNLTTHSNYLNTFYNGLDLKKVTVVKVSVSFRDRRAFARQPYFNSYDLFSQLGGIFNVFFGCSVLTLLELLQLLWYGLHTWLKKRRDTIQPEDINTSDVKAKKQNKKNKSKVKRMKIGKKKVTFAKTDVLKFYESHLRNTLEVPKAIATTGDA